MPAEVWIMEDFVNTVIEELENNKVKLTVTVPAADVDKAVASFYKDLASRANIPGFRKGKVPRPVLENAMGGRQVMFAQITEDVVNEAYPLAVDDNDLTPVARPEFAPDSALVEEHKDYTFEVTVECEPAFELSSYEPVEITMPSSEVSDAAVESQIQSMLSHYTDFKDKAEGATIADGDRVTMKLAAKTDGGRELGNLTGDEFMFTIGSVLMPETFGNELVGLKIGDTKSFDIPMPLNPTGYLSEMAGKALRIFFDAEIKGIKEKVNPDLTDEWVKDTFGFADVAEFRMRIREMLADDLNSVMPRMKEDRCMAALRARLLGEPTQAMCDDKESELMQNFFQQIQRQNVTFDVWLKTQGLTKEQFRDDVKRQAKDQSAENLALNAWAKHYGYTVTPEEITAEFVKADEEHAAELEAEWRANGQLHLLRQSMKREKAFNAVVEGAIVTDESEVAHKSADEMIADAEAAVAAALDEKPKAKKRSAKKKEAEAEAPAEVAEAAVEAAEEAPKPKKRSTKKKAAEAEAPAEAPEAAPAE